MSLKNVTKEMLDLFGKDVNYRVKLVDGRTYKSLGWDESVRQWRVKHGRNKKNNNKR